MWHTVTVEVEEGVDVVATMRAIERAVGEVATIEADGQDITFTANETARAIDARLAEVEGITMVGID